MSIPLEILDLGTFESVTKHRRCPVFARGHSERADMSAPVEGG
jgi:hypothetical protein